MKTIKAKILILFFVLLAFSFQSSAAVNPQLEKPVCGDDQNEYLVEEMGESRNSPRYDGEYGCTPDRSECLYRGSGEDRFYDQGEYRNTEEADEDVGRFKQDAEYCYRTRSDPFGTWYDQDYGDVDGDGNQETCRVNNLYGDEGVRWFSEGYVDNYPHAVDGGVDDDWNQLYDQRGMSKKSSPVPTGTLKDGKATVGFCGGDDGGEYLVTQQCNTNLCETDRSIIGVSANPDGCIFDPSTLSGGYSAPGTDKRDLYEPGDQIEIDVGVQSETIACFNNRWYENWPIVFQQEVVEVPFGSSSEVAFEVINVREEQTTFNVEMQDPLTDNPSTYQHSQFVERNGDSFQVTVPAESSRTFHVRIDGATRAIGDPDEPSEDDLTVRAEAVNSDMAGEDVVTAKVVENRAVNGTVRTSQPESVPGIGPLHIAVVVMLSSAVYFLQS